MQSAVLAFNDAGTPYSPHYDDIYHSAAGAWGQSEHVFLRGNQLPKRWAGRAQFTLLETGFGLGINFLSTWAAWCADVNRPTQLHFVSIEKHPLQQADLRQALEQCLASLGKEDIRHELAKQLCQHWPVLTPGLHRLCFTENLIHGLGSTAACADTSTPYRVTLTLALGDVAALLPNLHMGVDAFYLDGFAPKKNPQMWTDKVCKTLARYARDGATLATYTCAAQVRESLRSAGFIVSKQSGFGDKRDMLVGHFSPSWQIRRIAPPPVLSHAAQHAIVIGAGIMGCAIAAALAKHNWQVTLLEQAADVAQQTSAHRRASCHPLLTRDDNLMARAMRAGYWHVLKNPALQRCGTLQVAANKEEARQWQDMLSRLKFDSAFAQWLDKDQATAVSGSRSSYGGIWYPDGAWADIPALCHAYVHHANIKTIFDTHITHLKYQYGQWQACTAARPLQKDPDEASPLGKAHIQQTLSAGSGTYTAIDQGCIAQAPVLILANALGAAPLLQASALLAEERFLPLRAVRGQISYADIVSQPMQTSDAAPLAWPTAVLCGHGYLLPRDGQQVVIGASYAEDDNDGSLRDHDHQANLDKLRTLLPEFDAAALQINGGFVGQRCVALDRMPLVGAWPDTHAALTHQQTSHLQSLARIPQLYTALALGSQGLIWSALAAEILASAITGGPAPIEADLLHALDPARFLLRALRRV